MAVITKIKDEATYQVGVDILGFPIYVVHHIFTGNEKGNKIKPCKKFWIKVIEKIIKQH